MTTATSDLRQTPIDEIVPSQRARSALKGKGIKTLGDALDAGYPTLGKIPGVGEGTLDRIRTAAAVLPPEPEIEDEGEIDEGAHPILCESVYPTFRMSLLPAHRVGAPGGAFQVQQPHYLEFEKHRAELTKRAWLVRIYDRDTLRVDRAMADESFKWRKEAAAWLEQQGPFQNGDCRIMPD